MDDVRSGLTVVARRSEALSRFLAAYARLAKLPPPTLAPVSVPALVQRVAALDRTTGVRVVPGPAAWVRGDADQLEQLLINLLKNAVEAAGETGGGVTIGWEEAPGEVELVVSDEGPGLLDSRNLFVPFYTTKPEGSGIGLVLCRQIAEAHRGTLTLRNAEGRRGCDARLRLPRVAPPRREATACRLPEARDDGGSRLGTLGPRIGTPDVPGPDPNRLRRGSATRPGACSGPGRRSLVTGEVPMSLLRLEVRSALRRIARAPAFSAGVVLTLGLCIAANAVIATGIEGVLLRALPFRDPSRLVWIWSTRTDRDRAFFSLPNLEDTRARSTRLDALVGLATWGVNLTGDGPPLRLTGIRASGELGALLGRLAGAGPDARARGRRPVPARGRAPRSPALGRAVRPVGRRCSERR